MDSLVRLCEFCGNPVDGSFASGRFCNRNCANSFVSNQNIEEKNRKRSLALLGRKNPLSKETKKKISIAAKKRFADNPVVIKGAILNITRSELEDYRNKRNICEICGNKCITGRRLAADHDHKTNIFRGLLCIKCNMNYDWFLDNAEGILQYKEKIMRDGAVVSSVDS